MKKLLVLALIALMIAVVSVSFTKAGEPNMPDPNADPNAPKANISWFAAEPNAAEPNAVDPNAPKANIAWFVEKAVEPNAVDPNAPKDPNASSIVNFSSCKGKKVAEPNKCEPNAPADPNASK